MQLSETYTDIMELDYIDREFSVLNELFKFKFKRTNKVIDEWKTWLNLRKLNNPNSIEFLKNIGIEKMDDFL